MKKWLSTYEELSTCEDKIESVAGDTLSKPSSACKFKLVAIV